MSSLLIENHGAPNNSQLGVSSTSLWSKSSKITSVAKIAQPAMSQYIDARIEIQLLI